MTRVQIEFPHLRQAYLEVKSFLENEAREEVRSLNTTLAGDLGLFGDDNLDLLEKFVIRYKVDSTGFIYSEHFLSEDELFGSWGVLVGMLKGTLGFVSFLLQRLTLGRINVSKFIVAHNQKKQKSDMTFGDLLTWYLTKKYCLRRDAIFEIVPRCDESPKRKSLH